MAGFSLPLVIFLVLAHGVFFMVEGGVRALTAADVCDPRDPGCFYYQPESGSSVPFEGSEQDFARQGAGFLGNAFSVLTKLLFFNYSFFADSDSTVLQFGWLLFGVILGILQIWLLLAFVRSLPIPFVGRG